MDKKNISETRLILDIINKNEFHHVEQKEVYLKMDRFYLVYEFGHSDTLIVYGVQDYLPNSHNPPYINLYYYRAGSDVKAKVKQKLKKGYEQQFSEFDINDLMDREDDFVWKINYLYSKVFNTPERGLFRMEEDWIKYINQISVMKYVYCGVGKPLSVDNMTYMNEIYKNVTERLQK